jgi:hypothetical protein
MQRPASTQILAVKAGARNNRHLLQHDEIKPQVRCQLREHALPPGRLQGSAVEGRQP